MNSTLLRFQIVLTAVLVFFISVTFAALVSADTNLVPNASLETASGANPQGWSTDVWGTTKATFTYPTTGGHTGSRYVKTQITTKGNGDAKWYFNHIAATPNATYTFSDYYQSTVASPVMVEVLSTTNKYTYIDLGSAPISATWQKFEKTFTLPSNAKTFTVFHLIKAAGTLSVDDYLVTSGSTLPPPPPPPTFDFTLSNSGNKTVTQGSAITNGITATLATGTSQIVTFSASGTPANSSATFSAPSCTPTCSSNLSVVTSTTTPEGTYTVSVTGTAGSLTKTSSFSLIVQAVQPPPPPPPSQNLVPNSSVETNKNNKPTNWISEKWGKNTTTFSYLSDLGHTGTHSVKVQVTKYTDGDAKWDFTPVGVTPGDSYTLTDYYQSDVPTYPVIDFTYADGSHYYLGLRTAPASPNTWSAFTESFQVPANAKTMTLLHIITSVGYLTLDDVSIVKITPQGFNRGLVTIDFDDGWEDDVISTLPVLKQFGFNATYFFASTYIENSPKTGAINVSGPAAIHAIQADSNEIGGHSVTHPDLTTLSPADLDYELTHSKTYLESVAGTGNVEAFATPYGTYNDTVITKAKTLYNSLRSTDEGYNSKEDFNAYKLEVQNMEASTTLSQFQSWVNQAVKDKSWLILVYHRVATSSLEEFDTPVADFSPQMQAIKNSGIAVKTTTQALAEILPQVGQ